MLHPHSCKQAPIMGFTGSFKKKILKVKVGALVRRESGWQEREGQERVVECVNMTEIHYGHV